MSRLMTCLACGTRVGNMATGSTIHPNSAHLCAACTMTYLKIKSDPLVQMLHPIPKVKL